jgi:hypothetical protein
LGRLLIRRVGLRGDLADEAENPGLVAALLLPVRELEGAPGDFERVLAAAGQQMRLAKIGKEERVVGRARRRRVGERFLHEIHAFREATHQRVGIAEVPGCDVEGQPHLGDPTHFHGPLEREDGTGGVTAAQGDEPQAPVGVGEAVRMIELTGDADGLLSAGHRLLELAKLGKTPGETLPRGDRQKAGPAEHAAESLVELKGFRGPSQELDALAILSRRLLP